MDTHFTPELKDTTCSKCFCKDQKFLHHVWVGGKGSKICTSCVLFSNKQDFCPTCFDVSPKGELIRCKQCQSRSHAKCFFSNASLAGAPPVCATCRDPKKLVFRLSDLKVKGDNGHNKGIDMHASILLLTAAKIVHRSILKASDDADDFTFQVLKAVDSKEKVQKALKRVLKFDESNNDGPSDIDDLTDSEEDSYPETLGETVRLQRLSIEGAASGAQSRSVTMGIDLNEEYPSEDASI